MLVTPASRGRGADASRASLRRPRTGRPGAVATAPGAARAATAVKTLRHAWSAADAIRRDGRHRLRCGGLFVLRRRRTAGAGSACHGVGLRPQGLRPDVSHHPVSGGHPTVLKPSLCWSVAALVVCGAALADEPPKQDGKWRGSVGAGLNVTQSTTDSLNVNLAANAVRATAQEQWNFAAALLYGSAEDSAGVKTTSANLGNVGGRYAYNLSPRVFGFGSLDFNYDRLQEIDLRSVLAGGLGYRIIDTPAHRFDVSGGLTYNRTKYVNETVNSAEALLAEESNHQVSTGTTLRQRLAVFPNLSDTGEYRLQFSTGLVTKITDVLNLTVTLTDNYQSNPQPGIDKNELLFITGISVAFGGD